MCPYGRELFVEKAEIHFILEEFFNGLLGIADIVHVEQLHGRVGITAARVTTAMPVRTAPTASVT